MSDGEELFAFQLRAMKMDGWEREYKFHHKRKWRFDFALPEKMLAVEIEGGAWINGRHNRASGYIADLEKYNQAAILGWCVLKYTTEQIKAGVAIKEISNLVLTK